MTPPPCLECGQPTKRQRTKHVGTRGLRIIDGVVWGWFCGRRCTAYRHGMENVRKGLVARAEGHRAWVSRQRAETWRDEIDIMRRYHIPEDLAIGVLARVYRKGQCAVYQRYRQRKLREMRAA
jgi:hypothetical protein